MAMNSDIIIIGGGLAGLIQTIALAQNGFQVLCLDQNNLETPAPSDERTTAISYGSHLLLKKIGIWQAVEKDACPIQDIHITDGASPLLLQFEIEDIDEKTSAEAFGWIVENHVLKKALAEKLQNEKNATYLSNMKVTGFETNQDMIQVGTPSKQFTARLAIGADGRNSFTREWMQVGTKEWSYNQLAIVAIVTHTKPHHNIAIEHFNTQGPFAILPMRDNEKGEYRSSIVWTNHKNAKRSAAAYDDETFLAALNARFPDFYGDITGFSNKAAYPLSFNHAYRYIAPRMALISDAAHGIHPIAGQGLNLGLRDVTALSDILVKAKEAGNDIGDLKTLEQYQQQRFFDNTSMAVATDVLNKLFSNDIFPIKPLRRLGLKLISRTKYTKRFFMKQAMGLETLQLNKKNKI